MKDPHFTGRLDRIEYQEYQTQNGERASRAIIRLKTEEAKPQYLVLRLSRIMTDRLQMLQPEQHRVIVTAYLYFRQFDYTFGNEQREGQEVCAWRLELTFEDTNQIYTIDR